MSKSLSIHWHPIFVIPGIITLLETLIRFPQYLIINFSFEKNTILRLEIVTKILKFEHSVSLKRSSIDMTNCAVLVCRTCGQNIAIVFCDIMLYVVLVCQSFSWYFKHKNFKKYLKA